MPRAGRKKGQIPETKGFRKCTTVTIERLGRRGRRHRRRPAPALRAARRDLGGRRGRAEAPRGRADAGAAPLSAFRHLRRLRAAACRGRVARRRGRRDDRPGAGGARARGGDPPDPDLAATLAPAGGRSRHAARGSRRSSGFHGRRSETLVEVPGCLVVTPGDRGGPAGAGAAHGGRGEPDRRARADRDRRTGRARRRRDRRAALDPGPAARSGGVRGGRGTSRGLACGGEAVATRRPPFQRMGDGPRRAAARRLPAGHGRGRGARWWRRCARRSAGRGGSPISSPAAAPSPCRSPPRAEVLAVEGDAAMPAALAAAHRPAPGLRPVRTRDARPLPPAAAGARSSPASRRW